MPANPESNANPGGFCDPRIDAEIEAALAQTDADPASANAAWAAIDRRLVDAAPVVPLFDRRSVTVVSERVQNVQLPSLLGRAPRPALGPVAARSPGQYTNAIAR